ncbi:hypothetical protein D3C78_19270 [compost metagenome]
MMLTPKPEPIVQTPYDPTIIEYPPIYTGKELFVDALTYVWISSVGRTKGWVRIAKANEIEDTYGFKALGPVAMEEYLIFKAFYLSP